MEQQNFTTVMKLAEQVTSFPQQKLIRSNRINARITSPIRSMYVISGGIGLILTVIPSYIILL